jgi:hypothetical protein
MSKAIEQVSGMTLGHVKLGYRGGVTGSVRHQVHDGDTFLVQAVGNFGVRMLAVDAPEMSFLLPGKSAYVSLSDSKWETFLSDPFAKNMPAFKSPLTPGLLTYLQARVGPGTAANHYRHAVDAEDALEREVLKDLKTLGQSEDTFQFILVCAFEVTDRYGRFLGYINRNQPDAKVPEPRPPTYNLRLLQEARVSPYFIWPNIDPFRKQGSLINAVIAPGKANTTAKKAAAIKQVRQSMADARKLKMGIFDEKDPLKLEPFELRFLAQRYPPGRWVIDLSRNDDTLISPQNYYTIPNSEDRLYIPEEYVPLFVEKGWKRQA